MNRNLKTLGVALSAMLTLGAVAASPASATDVFTATESIETISGTATNGVVEITGVGLSAQCATVNLHAVVENGASAGSGEAALEGTPGATDEGHCGSSLGEFEIKVNGCEIVITGNTNESGHAEAWLTCPEENELEMITSFGVTISAPAQTPTAGGITYTNMGDGTVLAEATVEGITYSCTPHFLCTLGGAPTEGNSGDLSGSILMSGANGPIAFSEE